MHLKQNIWFIILIALSVINVSNSQEWKFVGGPEGINSHDILFTKDGKLISATYDGIYISKNYGDNWARIEKQDDTGTIYKLTQLLNGNILGVAASGIFLSTDTCNTWITISDWYGLNNYSTGYLLESPIDSSLYTCEGNYFYKSIDHGTNWEAILFNHVIDGFTIDDAGIIYLGVRPGYLFRSVDNGVTFQTVDISSLTNDSLIDCIISDLFPADSGGVYFKFLGNSQDGIYHYHSSGLQRIETGWLNPPLGVTANHELIYKSSNCLKLYNPTNRTSITKACQYFVRDQLAKEVITYNKVWIANISSEFLFQSKDNGRTWKDIHSGHGFRQVLSIDIADSGRIIAGTFGASFWGALFKSKDNGSTWTRIQKTTLDAYFVDISTLKTGRIIANGSYGAYVSDNGGDTWTKKSGISLAYSQFVSKSGYIYVGNDYKGIYLSTDNGNKWKSANNGINHSYFFNFGESKSGKIFASAWPTGTYCSSDSGKNWTYLDGPYIANTRTFCFDFKDDTLYAGSSHGLLKSINDGNTWERVQEINGSVHAITCALNGDIIINADKKNILVKKTGQDEWHEFNDGVNNKVIYLQKMDHQGRIYLATNSGVYRTDDFMLKEEQETKLTIFLQQNFPNPFNSGTKIKFKIFKKDKVKVSVFNILGQKIAVLLNSELDAGTHEVEFDGGTLPSGIYLYRIEAYGYQETKKMIIIK